MQRRVWFKWCVPVLITAAAILVWRIWLREPARYQGKTVSQWFDEFRRFPRSLGRRVSVTSNYPRGRIIRDLENRLVLDDPPLDALRALGPDAVPYLVKTLKTGGNTAFGTIQKRLRDLIPFLRRLPQGRVGFLDSPSQIRKDAADALVGIGEMKSRLPELLEAVYIEVRDSDYSASTFLDHALTWMKRFPVPPGEIERLLQRLSRASCDRALLKIVEQLDLKSPDAAKALASILENNDAFLRMEALRLLEPMGLEAEESVPDVIGAMRDTDSDVRYRAARVLGSIGNRSVEVERVLEIAVKDRDSRVRAFAARSLSVVRGEPAISISDLLDQFKNREPGAERAEEIIGSRRFSTERISSVPSSGASSEIHLLGRLDTVSVLGAPIHLQQLISSLTNANSEIRLAAVRSLGELGKDAAMAVESLVSVLNDANPVVRSETIKTLGEIGERPEISVPALADLLDDSSMVARANAILAIGKFGAEATNAKLALARALDDSSSAVRSAAEAVLKSMSREELEVK